jgi:PAS domain S-box-containing protein
MKTTNGGRAKERIETVARLSRLVTSSLDVDQALAAVAQAVLESFDTPGVFFWIADEPARRLDLRLVVPSELAPGLDTNTMSYDQDVGGWVARHRRVLNVSDVSADPRALSREWWQRHRFVSALVVPVVAADALLGVLSIVGRAPFSDEDAALAEGLAAHAAGVLHNAAVFARSEARRQAAEALAEVGRLLSQTLDPETVGRRVTESVCRLLDARSATIYRIVADGSFEAVTVSSAAEFPWLRQLPASVGIAGLALRERQPVATSDLLEDPRLHYAEAFKAQVAQNPYRALLAVPLVAQGREFGVVAVGDRTGRHFSDDDMRLTQAFADQAAVALENARLYGEASRQAGRMRALADVERLLSETLDVESITRRIVETLRALLDSRTSVLYRVAGEDLVVAAVAGDAGPTFSTGLRFPMGAGLVSVALNEQRPAQTANVLDDQRVWLPPELRERIEGASYRAALSAPLIVNERLVGALSVGDATGRVYDDDEVRLVQAFADQAGRALENARLYEEADRRRREAEELAQVASVINASLDATRVLPRVLEAARALTGANLSRLALRDPARDVMVFRFADGATDAHADIHRGKGLGGLAWVTGRAVRTDDQRTDPRVGAAALDVVGATDVRATIVVPIIIGGLVEGLLSVANTSAAVFDTHHEAVLQRLADQAAIAMHNTRLFADEQASRASAQAAAQALRESEAVLQRAMEVGQIGSWTSSVESDGPLEWSHEVFRIFGVNPAGFRGAKEDFLERVHPDDLAQFLAARADAVATGQPLRIDHRIVRPDGTVRWVHERADVQRDAAGRPVCFIGVVQDVTERKQAEEALKTAEEQLRQSQKMDAIGRLAGGVAHDFNNLLSIITGRSELLLRHRELAALVRRDIELIHRTADRAAGLTRQLLAFSRKQMLQPKVLDLNTVVATMGRMLRRVIGEDVDLVIVARPGLARVNADPGQLEQVILNLAVNARDAMPGGGRLTIETADVDLDEDHARLHAGIGPGRHVMLAVTDTGVGMEATVRDRIFEPFFTTKEVGKGTGLGLSTVYGIVQQSGGTIWVYSEPGRGSTFKIYLPSVNESAHQADLPPEPPRGGHETVLLCEDEADLRELTRDVLEEYGYRVIAAGDGKEALEVAAGFTDRIDLLLTDVVMPRMNGSELAKTLARERGVRVLYMSGYTETSMVRGDAAPGAGFLQKPFSPVVLARAVRELLDTPS